MSYVDLISKDEVKDPVSFSAYVEQTLGVPYGTAKDMMILKKKLKDFFLQYPHCEYGTLLKVVDYCKSKKRRLATTWRVVDQVKWAFEHGYIPELTKPKTIDVALELKIAEAVKQESDVEWQRRLIASSGAGREHVYSEWLETRG